MSIKVKAVERELKVGQYAGEFRYMMQTEIYNKLSQTKVIQEAALRSGISKGSINAAWDAIGEVIKAWATEGHSVAIPGLGTMRFAVNATSVADVNKVASSLITSRKVLFTPSVDIKNELKATAISITCYDRNGDIVKRVTSADDGDIEDPENSTPDGGDDNPSGGNPSDGQQSTDNGQQTPSGGNTQSGGNTNQGGGTVDENNPPAFG